MSNQLFTTIRWCGVLSDGYETWMARGINQLGRDVAGEVETELQLFTEMVQALT